ncbi:MAG: response regulator [Proteobacteria bacterium]|nr:response regulator [Pseudomonadota bacterium]
MNVKAWNVCLIEPNKFEGQIIVDILRNAGVDNVRVFNAQEDALLSLAHAKANVIVASYEMAPLDGAAWTKAFRRSRMMPSRKAAVFITSAAFSRAMAEDCRHAGANALIGKPLSAKVLLATINKVLTQPREFIDAEGYVGPCRRAGIVTAGAPSKRRKGDEGAVGGGGADTLAQAFSALILALTQLAQGRGGGAQCEGALRRVQAFAVNANDAALMSVCGTLAQQLTTHDLRSETGKQALHVCAAGIARLAELELGAKDERAQVATQVKNAIAKIALAQAAA